MGLVRESEGDELDFDCSSTFATSTAVGIGSFQLEKEKKN
jgi:hypothetical protein